MQIFYIHKSMSDFNVSNYHHSVILKTFLNYIIRSSSEDTRAAYMGYEDCLVLHVFTTDVNASLPGSRWHQRRCLKPFCLYKLFSFLELDGRRVFTSLNMNMTLSFEFRFILKLPLPLQCLFGSMAVVLLLGWLACMNLTSSWTTRYIYYFKHKSEATNPMFVFRAISAVVRI